jgi:hypothetical protein
LDLKIEETPIFIRTFLKSFEETNALEGSPPGAVILAIVASSESCSHETTQLLSIRKAPGTDL